MNIRTWHLNAEHPSQSFQYADPCHQSNEYPLMRKETIELCVSNRINALNSHVVRSLRIHYW